MRSPESHLEAVADLIPGYGCHLEWEGDGIPNDYYEQIPLAEAVDRVTTFDIHAELPSPPFNNSQMDGYAISDNQLALLPTHLPVGPTIAAGTDPTQLYPQGITDEVAPVMTGARLPDNAVAVIPVEKGQPDTFDKTDHYGVDLPATTAGTFVREEGSDIAVGTLLIERNTKLTPLHIAALTSQKIETVTVWRKARVVLCTGGAEIGGEGPASIPDVNGPLLVQLCEEYGIEPVASIHTNDDVVQLRASFEQTIEQYQPDAIITSGGISHGRFEVIRSLLEGDHAWFGHVDQQPGGPQGLAVFNDVPVICLPGNPISTLVSFRLFVAPLIGVNAALNDLETVGEIRAVITESVEGLSDHRDQFRRGTHRITEQGTVEATILGGASSHLLAQAADADCLIRIPARASLQPGDMVTIYPL
ncbi:MAG: molybdopterin molybdotransferase MoeA [Actinomycetaceae bacterium]|nr:molybdopterin molybdotransferase MoeA [Actinomycetaceae bacterium]